MVLYRCLQLIIVNKSIMNLINHGDQFIKWVFDGMFFQVQRAIEPDSFIAS